MKKITLRIVPPVIAYIFLKIVSHKIGFSYSLFSDRFDLTKFIIDLGIFTCGYAITCFSLTYFFKNKQLN